MKTLTLNFLTTVFLFIFLSTSCDQNDASIQNKIQSKYLDEAENSFPRISIDSKIGGIDLPNGTIMDKVDRSTVKIIFPEGYELWEINDNKVSRFSQTTYTCTCSDDGGCDVFYVGGNYGCSHGTCSGSCTGEFKSGFLPIRARFYVINTNSKMQPATDEEFEKLKYIPGALVPYFEEEFNEYGKNIYGERFLLSMEHADKSSHKTSDINDVMFVKMKIYGYKFAYGISTKGLKPHLMRSNQFIPVSADEKHSCKCESGNSGCTADSSWGVKYCKADSCSKCSMTVE